jgi:hypothetical protein
MCRAILVCLIIVVFLSGCTRDEAPLCQTCPTISFRTDIIPIFQTYCTAGCHTGPVSSAKGHFTLDSAVAYSQATEAGTGYVVAGNANYSLLYSELLAGNSLHMPVSYQLDPCTIQKIQCWINQGALNN